MWRDGAEGLGRVLRAHIYGHARWERAVSDECSAALDAHEHARGPPSGWWRRRSRKPPASPARRLRWCEPLDSSSRSTRTSPKRSSPRFARRSRETRTSASRAGVVDGATRRRAPKPPRRIRQRRRRTRGARAAAARAGVLPSALAVPEADDAAPTRDSSDVVSDLLARSSANPSFRARAPRAPVPDVRRRAVEARDGARRDARRLAGCAGSGARAPREEGGAGAG